MKKIICYGDSNTFGFNPSNALRYNNSERWSGIIKNELKQSYDVIEEGLNNRCGFTDNPQGELYCALIHLPKLLNKFSDIDILILAIGTNDLQFLFNISFDEIKEGLINLINISKTKVKHIILIPPVIMNNNIINGYFKFQFDILSIEKAKKANEIYRKIAKQYNCFIFDFNEFVHPSDIDGLHYNKEEHKLIASKLKNFINNIPNN